MDIGNFNKKYGRQALIVSCTLIWVYIVWSFFANGYIATWYQWHIPAKEPPFIDFRLIPSGAETFRSGIDPAISNPNDPKQHIFNYPKIWYIFFYTNITQDDTIWLSILLIVLFFFTVFVFPEKLNVVDTLLTLLVVFSPASMLLYERGNVDLAFFTLCGLSIWLLALYPAGSAVVLLIAAMFKFFPFFGVGIFLQANKNRFYKYFFGSLSVFLIYLALSFDSLTAAWKLTQRGTIISYGVYVIFDILKAYFHYYLLKIMSQEHVVIALKWLPHLVAIFFGAIAFFLGIFKKEPLKAETERNLTAFRMGALIYIGTFLLGNNWDYRLAFLIFTVPQISRWIFSLNWKQRWFIVAIFISLLSSCWFMFFNSYIMSASDYGYEFQMKIFDEVMNWILFGGLIYLFAVSAPEWFRALSWSPFTQKIDENA